ncbi:hypothetical protein BHE97_05670 [Aeromicrobium sp. PE09-221]|uniref:FhaA domain-containing protein n=1 Tax=Aeromicrobium sp. PE09-221 TaxID=1898043 RepID=UPI000B3EE05D|nr:FhaA domain-containing protein [Aeromicrobium sp. PE09-221]OUZ11323.1 hypothetical protein BHE97_05670 [Aeromicrobium sp. PE09-221]
MSSTIASLTMNLLILAVFAGVVVLGLRVAQSVFKTDTKRAAATELAAKLVAYPTGSSGVLRRRFVRALTGQHLIMPSGERLAFAELTVRIAPEDLERLDPDGDVERLGADGAKLYAAHARRSGWGVPADVTVHVEIDPGLRSGWIPPARAIARAGAFEPVETGSVEIPRADRRKPLGWEVVTDDPEPATAEPIPLRPVPSGPELDPAATALFSAFDADDEALTVNVAPTLRLRHGEHVVEVPREGTAVLGRVGRSVVRFTEPEVSGRHAAVRLRAGRWEVADLGSTNGTTLDGEPIESERWTPLRSGAVLALAGVPLDVTIDVTGTVNLADVTSR